MKKLFLLAWPIALAAVSCSNEEVVSVNNDANEIKFTAVAENATRANTDETFCNNALPGSFDVWACTDAKKSYFQKVTYTKTSATEWTAPDGNVRFWPNKGAEKLDFFALRNYQGEPTWDAANTTTKLSTVFTVNTNVAAQEDLIYAVATEQTKPGAASDASNPNAGKVNLNFRHALSQIVFQAKNTNQNLAVKITQVEILNVANSGTCKLPIASTWKNYEDHNGDNKDNAADKRPTPVCTWDVDATTADYLVLTEDCFLEGNKNNVVNLTNGSEAWPTTDSAGHNPGDAEYVPTTRRNLDRAMLLIPQETTPATISTTKKPSELRNGEGAMIAVKCQIWNLNEANHYVAANDVLLYDKIAYIPLDATWEAGKKYIYTLVFGNANGGYDEDGKDILVPISFNVTVDDFTTVVEGEINMYK